MEDVTKEQSAQLAKVQSGLKFKATKLAEAAIISETGLVEVEALYDVTVRNRVGVEREDGTGTFHKYICTLKAFAQDSLEAIRLAFTNPETGDILSEVPIESMNGLLLTANFIEKEGLDLPMAGQKIKCNIQWVTPKDQPEKKLLRVVNAQPVKVYSAAKKVNLKDFFANPAAMDGKTETVVQTTEETLKQPA